MKLEIGKQYKINVTQADIDDAEPGNSYRCPVARALDRMFDDEIKHDSCAARYESISVAQLDEEYPYSKYYLAKTPPRVVEFMQKFDNHSSVRPFQFRITFHES